MSFANKRVTSAYHWFLRLIREPLAQFFVLGAVVFVLSQYSKARADNDTIWITPGQIRVIHETFRQQYGRAASPTKFEALVTRRAEQEAS